MSIRSLDENGQTVAHEVIVSAPRPAKRARTGIVIFSLFVLSVSGIILYFTFAPALCPVLYHVPEESLVSPANATVCFLAPPGSIKTGSPIAEVLIRPDSGGEFLEHVHLLRERLKKLDSENSARTQALEQKEKELDDLSGKLTLAEANVRIAEQAKKRAVTLRDIQKKRMETATRLFQLEALRHSELSYAEELFTVAEAEAEKMELQLRSAELQLELSKKQAATAAVELKRMRAVTENQHMADRVLRKQLVEQMSDFEFVSGGVKIKFKALQDGVIGETALREGSRVSAGDVLARISSEKSATLEAFVAGDAAESVTKDSLFRVSLGKRVFYTSVQMLSSRLEPLPHPLKTSVKKENTYYRRFFLRIPKEYVSGWLNNQTGAATVH